MHVTIEPGVLYFRTPVVLIRTVNEDGSFNLAPMSSAFWLGWRCVLGLAATSKTPQNMARTGECVLNLPSAALAGMVDREPNRIDPDQWRPLILSFQEFYGLGPKVHRSQLGTIPETLYRGPDIERGRGAMRVGGAMVLPVTSTGRTRGYARSGTISASTAVI